MVVMPTITVYRVRQRVHRVKEIDQNARLELDQNAKRKSEKEQAVDIPWCTVDDIQVRFETILGRVVLNLDSLSKCIFR